jgi:hypothetical protein
MKVEALHISMSVRHPQYGKGTVKSVNEHGAEIRFEDGTTRTVAPEASGLQPAEPQVAVSGLEQPLAQLIEHTVQATLQGLGLDRSDLNVEKLGQRWHKGRLVMHPADPTIQTKEVPLEVFFHKIVMMRNNFRVLEQKVNAHPQLSDAEKVEMQQYISRCYGSLTTFNVLFRDKEDHFSGAS